MAEINPKTCTPQADTSKVPHTNLAMGEECVTTSTPQAASSKVPPTNLAIGEESVTTSTPPAASNSVSHPSIVMDSEGTANAAINAIGGETVVDSGQTTPTDSTFIASEGPTSAGDNAIVGGTVVDSGQTTTHTPTTPLSVPEGAEVQLQPNAEARAQAQGDTYDRSCGDRGVDDDCQGGDNENAHRTEEEVQQQTPPPPSAHEVHTAVPVSLTVAELKQLWKDATAKEKEEKNGSEKLLLMLHGFVYAMQEQS
jgi:hypothetical protein